MKKIVLFNNEKIIHRVRFSLRIFLIDIVFAVACISLNARLPETKYAILGIPLLIVFILLIIKSCFDFYRIFFHRVYISNLRVIYFKGYLLKRIKFYHLDTITGVYYRSNFFDRAQNMTSFKVTTNDDRSFILKNIKEGNKIADLLSYHMLKEHEKNIRKTRKGKITKK